MPESGLEKAICDFAFTLGWINRKIRYIGRRGCPDRYFFRKGELLMVEFKTTDRGRQSMHPGQKRERARMGAAGFYVHVICDYEAGCELFKEKTKLARAASLDGEADRKKAKITPGDPYGPWKNGSRFDRN